MTAVSLIAPFFGRLTVPLQCVLHRLDGEVAHRWADDSPGRVVKSCKLNRFRTPPATHGKNPT